MNAMSIDPAYTSERFFLPAPLPIRACAPEVRPGASEPSPWAEKWFGVYLDQSQNRMRWSASFPLPRIGDRVKVNMNGIGVAKVVGYFSSPGGKDSGIFLGVMALPEDPPKWLRDQVKRAAKDESRPQWIRDGVGCYFGTELELLPGAKSESSASPAKQARALRKKSKETKPCLK